MRRLFPRLALTAAMVAGFGLAEVSTVDIPVSWMPSPVAHADWDDDDDDDGGYYRAPRFIPAPPAILRHLIPPPPRRQAPRRAAPAAPPPPPEFVVTAPTPGDLDAISAQGFEIVSRSRLELIGAEVARVRVPPGLSLEDARAQVGQIVPDAQLDINHLYRPGDLPCREERCAAFDMIGWTPRTQACELAPVIGMIDTTVNVEHAALSDADIEFFPAVADDRDPASALHGTAIAILLAGDNETRTPGLLPRARVIAAEAFHRDPRGEDAADAFDVARAIEELVEREVQVINLSFTGPANILLERVVEAALERDVALVAAAGNAGPRSEPLYPAAYDGVVAVTAVDRSERVFRQANAGPHIAFAAPGVRIGRRPRSPAVASGRARPTPRRSSRR